MSAPPIILCKVCNHNDFFHVFSDGACADICGCKQMVFPRRFYKRFDLGFLISPKLIEEFIE